jgi:hypothetical protein
LSGYSRRHSVYHAVGGGAVLEERGGLRVAAKLSIIDAEK